MRPLKQFIFVAILLLLFSACANERKPEVKNQPTAASDQDTPVPDAVASAGTELADGPLKPSVLSFSKESGMYSEHFLLTITATGKETIYYTTDGSDPLTSRSSEVYTEPLLISDKSGEPNILASLDPTQFTLWYSASDLITPKYPIDKCNVIRAATKGCFTDTKTYFIGQKTEDYNHVAILSLVTDPANFFDYESGIYLLGKSFDDYKSANPGITPDSLSPANYNMRGREWERPVHIDFFESDGSLVLSQDCGVRIQGNYSRGDVPKSLRFYARKDYGSGNFGYDFLGDAVKDALEVTTRDTFVLRTGANDSYYTKFKDSYLQSLVSDRRIETQTGRACILFLDGEYWGLYTLQEDYTDDYFNSKYAVDKDQVIYYKNNKLDEGDEADLSLYTDLIAFAKSNNLSNPDHYETLSRMLDIDSFIDYMAIELYIINEDWPGHNTGLWRTRELDPGNSYADGRWRFTLYDTEMGAYHYGNASTRPDANNLAVMLENKDDPGILFQALLKNETFKQQFVTVFMDLTNVNFEAENTLTQLEPFLDTYYPEMERFFQRFKTWANYENATDECITRMKLFFSTRGSYVPGILKDALELQGEAVDITVNVNAGNGGVISVNTTTPDMTKGSWTGRYFTDYPITLTAAAADGFTFAGWSGSIISSESTITVSFQEALTLNAEFTEDSN